MTTHSSILAWRIPWTEKLGGLQSMGSQIDKKRLSTCHENNHTYYTYFSTWQLFYSLSSLTLSLK